MNACFLSVSTEILAPDPDRILAALIMTAIVIYMVSVFLSTLLN